MIRLNSQLSHTQNGQKHQAGYHYNELCRPGENCSLELQNELPGESGAFAAGLPTGISSYQREQSRQEQIGHKGAGDDAQSDKYTNLANPRKRARAK